MAAESGGNCKEMHDLMECPMNSPRASVLLVEDEPELRQLISDSLEAQGFAVAQAVNGADAIERLHGFVYDALIVDLCLPDKNGMEILDEALTLFPLMRAVVITGFGGIDEAVVALKRGAIDFLQKPFQLERLGHILTAAVEARKLRQENAELRAQLQTRFRFDNIVGSSPAMRAVFSTLELVAPMNSTVLIEGETGTGKELIARAIHHHSPRRDKQFIAFNAAAIPDGLAEAELFGHTKGAFTGASQARTGRFELASKGTLFIDEVSSMSLSLQAKLLRALQERQIERVGESTSIPIDVRVVAAANMDLRKMVKEGTFREDLYYRLNVVPVRLPPLRERGEDIPMLAHHCVRKSCEANGMPLRTLDQDALRCLKQYSWPGNIRQLENAIEHAVAMSGAEHTITAALLPPEIRLSSQSVVLPTVAIPDEGVNLVSLVSQLERELILRCLEKTGGNKRQAAKLLQLSRTTLIDKLHRLTVTGDFAAA
jgi:DNA-binding NtrC family response regulator